jgi:hypothetical protein
MTDLKLPFFSGIKHLIVFQIGDLFRPDYWKTGIIQALQEGLVGQRLTSGVLQSQSKEAQQKGKSKSSHGNKFNQITQVNPMKFCLSIKI